MKKYAILEPIDNTRLEELLLTEQCSFGRALTNDHVCPLPFISRQHCKISFDRTLSHWVLSNLGCNRITVNDITVDKSETIQINDQNVITFGENVHYRFSILEKYWTVKKAMSQGNSTPTTTTTTSATSNNSCTNFNEMLSLECRVTQESMENQRANTENRKLMEQLSAYDCHFKKLTNDANLLQNEKVKLLEKIKVLEKDFLKLTEDLNTMSEDLKKSYDRPIASYATPCGSFTSHAPNSEGLVICTLISELTGHSHNLKRFVDRCYSNYETATKNQPCDAKVKESQQLVKSDIENCSNCIEHLHDKIVELRKIHQKNEMTEEVIDKAKGSLYQLLENNFQCSICNDLFVKATALNCSHTFCKACIETWRLQRTDCPVCRMDTVSIAPSISIDNVIDEILQRFYPDKYVSRIELKEQHVERVNETESRKRNRSLAIVEIGSSDSEDSDSDESIMYFANRRQCHICGSSNHMGYSCPHRGN